MFSDPASQEQETEGHEPNEFPGDHGEGETPVPIPNTEVKPLSGDGTVGLAMGE